MIFDASGQPFFLACCSFSYRSRSSLAGGLGAGLRTNVVFCDVFRVWDLEQLEDSVDATILFRFPVLVQPKDCGSKVDVCSLVLDMV